MSISDNLSERRGKDRELMAIRLADELRSLGATVSVKRSGSGKLADEVLVAISVAHEGREATCGVKFSKTSHQPDMFVTTWNTKSCFSPHMNDSTVNKYHYGKATRAMKGFPALLAVLGSDVRILASGAGFSPEREEIVRKRAEDRSEELIRVFL